MWVLKDLMAQKGVVEIALANPSFYITQFCIGALAHMNQHHNEFYSNIENRSSLPQVEPYNLQEARELQDLAT